MNGVQSETTVWKSHKYIQSVHTHTFRLLLFLLTVHVVHLGHSALELDNMLRDYHSTITYD